MTFPRHNWRIRPPLLLQVRLRREKGGREGIGTRAHSAACAASVRRPQRLRRLWNLAVRSCCYASRRCCCCEHARCPRHQHSYRDRAFTRRAQRNPCCCCCCRHDPSKRHHRSSSIINNSARCRCDRIARRCQLQRASNQRRRYPSCSFRRRRCQHHKRARRGFQHRGDASQQRRGGEQTGKCTWRTPCIRARRRGRAGGHGQRHQEAEDRQRGRVSCGCCVCSVVASRALKPARCGQQVNTKKKRMNRLVGLSPPSTNCAIQSNQSSPIQRG